MRVGWLVDNAGYVGGAELTMREFFRAVPEGIEITVCPPGEVEKGLDAYVIGNCVSYGHAEVKRLRAPLIKYVHDMWPAGDTNLRAHLLRRARLIFTSPLHLDRFPHRIRASGAPLVIPPGIDLNRFRDDSNGSRSGAVCVGRMAHGKGIESLVEWGEPVDVYSSVPLDSRGNLVYRGEVEPGEVPDVLRRYSRFVFLPTVVEPFGRAVVEAWASGCELQVNRNVGALHWIEEDPMALGTARSSFWRAVRNA